MNAKHTPGPWSVHGDSHTLIGADDGKMMLASAFHKHAVCEWQRTQAEAQANARLIAAAPELLAALQLAWKYYNDPTYQDDLTEIAFADDVVAALEKATGEPCEV
jgi:hypothetical protein